ncbi:UDP diphospho-muramoyl pentapeptide beta-N acetylglucosaminyl transferase [Synergistales bacterium]|nr:UDP diphospho-muramoyl pentapeptide beta-N acetylglucosaminyl transferase [Synergistales bacterium]
MPAAAFGDWIMKNQSGVSVKYICGSRPLEAEIYGSLKISPFVINIEGSPIAAPRGKKLKRWSDLARGFFAAKDFMLDEKPDLCVLFGGYISLGVMLLSKIYGRRAGIKTVAHEQNARAGRVTRIASRLGVQVMSGWRECCPLGPNNYRYVGVPARALRDMTREEAGRELGLTGTYDATVLVMTGSLGSGKISELIGRLAERDELKNWRFLIIDSKIKGKRNLSENVTALPRMWDISPLFAAADVLMTRCGASTLSEVEASGLPAVIVPWRGAADDHQMANARQLRAYDRIKIWDEGAGQEELARGLLSLGQSSGGVPGGIGKTMYNTSGSICKNLWEFCRCAEGSDRH